MPTVLIIDRNVDASYFCPDLHWCDSSGSRAVWYYNPREAEYDTAEDLPEDIFTDLKTRLERVAAQAEGMTVSLCIRREDPGLGIFIPELDDPVIQSGGVPDGCIPVSD